MVSVCLTVVPDVPSRPGCGGAASDVVGRLALVERLESTVVDELFAVAGRETVEKGQHALSSGTIHNFLT